MGQLIQLTAETPTINDAASAKKEQPFLVNAANGDVLIVYPKTAATSTTHIHATSRNRRNSLVCALLLFLLAPLVYASDTRGIISTTSKYAWRNVGGYVNFAPANSTVSVTDSSFSGHAWSANTVGSIALPPRAV